MLMCHVDMQLLVARNLEEDHLAVVRERTIRRQSSDGGLHRRDVGRPRIRAQRVPRRDDPRAFAAAVSKGTPGQDFHMSRPLLLMDPVYAHGLPRPVLYCTGRGSGPQAASATLCGQAGTAPSNISTCSPYMW